MGMPPGGAGPEPPDRVLPARGLQAVEVPPGEVDRDDPGGDLLDASERQTVDQAIAATRTALSADKTVVINQAMAALNTATAELAARRMDRNIRRALTGQKISEL